MRDPYFLSLHTAGEDARGTVLVLHGGAWRDDLGAAADELMGELIDGLNDWGYDVANLGYRSGARGLDDALSAFDRLRTRLDPGEPLCIYGTSAGAQLALIVAAERGADVDCVVDLLGPPDLEDFGSRPRSAAGERLARRAFGADGVAALSPVNNVSEIRTPVLVAATPCDVLIGLGEQRMFVRELNAAGGTAELRVIAPGNDVDLEHCAVDAASFAEFQRATREFLDAVAPEPASADPAPDSDDEISPLLLLAVVAVLAGLGLLARAIRR